jgi:hypothetical protein
MSHAAAQIRDWFKAACTGVPGLPTATEGTPRQIESNTDACFVRTTLDAVSESSLSEIDIHEITVEVTVVGNTFTEADGLCLLAEEAIAAKSPTIGDAIVFVQREYTENRDTDRDYVSVSLTYAVRYSVARGDVETFL